MNVSTNAVSQLARTVSNNNVGRYMGAVGYVAFLYDAFLTFPEECEFVWHSKPNFAKYAFLGNKYAVLAILTMEMIIVNNSGGIFSVKFCRSWLVIHALVGVISICISNALVLLRVAVLWNNQKSVVFWLFTMLFITTGMSLVAGVVGVVIWIPYITYQPDIQTCGFKPDAPSHFFAPTWGIPLVFDFYVLCIVIINALQRPRAEDTQLTRILIKDGLAYFALLTFLRLYNVLTVAIAPIGLVFSGAYISWAIITITMSRLMLKIRKPHEQVERFEWPTGNAITAITVTTTDNDSGYNPPSVPIALSHLTPNGIARHSHNNNHRSEGGEQSTDLMWSGEVFKHGRYSPAIPPQLNAFLRAEPGSRPSASKHTLASTSSFASSSSRFDSLSELPFTRR